MLQLGEQVGPYTICNHLITGGCSEVYKASVNGQFVALKILREDQRHESLVSARMTNEALALSRIQDPGVVEILGHGQHEDGRPYLALELLHRSLAQSLPLPAPQAVSLGESLARTLAALHEIGIVHRDLKPANVMLTDGAQPKLVDFGLAKLPVAAATSDSPLLLLSTEPGVFFGTLAYSAPEQIADAKQADGRADVYSLGVILFEMLVHRRPFVATERGRLISMHINDAPPSLTSLNSRLPPALAALVSRMLAKNPSARPDAGEVAEALSQVSFTTRRSYRTWLRAVPLILMPLYPAPSPSLLPTEKVVESYFSQFESTLFTSTIADAEAELRETQNAMRLLRPTPAYQTARLQYKQAAIAKERGAIQETIQLFEESRKQWQALIASQPGQAYKALSICADGIGEMYYHLGEYDRALSNYQDAAHTLPRTLAAAQSRRQVPSFLDYQRALVYQDLGDTAAALHALEDAEGHERVLLAQLDAAPEDRWQLARVLTLRADVLMQQSNSDGALAAATEAERLSRQARIEVPNEKRFRLGHLLALDRLAAVAAARGQILPRQELEALAGLRTLAQGDPASGHWAHELIGVLVRRSQRSQGGARRLFAEEALALMQQMENRRQWHEDIHLRRWHALAAELAGS